MKIEKMIKELRKLNEPVPKPMRLPTMVELQKSEKKLGLTFNSDYKKFLLQASDVCVNVLEPCTILDDGSHTELTLVAKDAWELDGLPKELLPICQDNGDYYCIAKTGEIRYWSHNGTTDESWPDLATWIKKVWIEKG